MNSRSKGRFVATITAASILLLFSCTTAQDREIELATEAAMEIQATETSLAISITATPTRTPTPTTTPTPSSTPTPTRVSPVQEGTVLPQSDTVISPENIDRLNLLAKWPAGSVLTVVFSPDGESLAAYSNLPYNQFREKLDGTIRIWRLEDGHLLNTFKIPSSFSIAITPDGEELLLLSTQQMRVEAWSIEDAQRVKTWGQNNMAMSIATDGERLATIGWSNTYVTWRNTRRYNGLITYYAYPSLARTQAFEISSPGSCHIFSPDLDWVIGYGGFGGPPSKCFTLWQLSDGTNYPLCAGDNIYSMAFSADEALLALGRADGTIDLLSVEDQSYLGKFSDPSIEGDRLISLAFSPDGQILAALNAEENQLTLWRVSDGTLLAILHTQQTTAPEREITLVGWNNLITGPAARSQLAFSPDGKTLAAARAGRIQIWGIP
jgi:WD40 repeat protein